MAAWREQEAFVAIQCGERFQPRSHRASSSSVMPSSKAYPLLQSIQRSPDRTLPPFPHKIEQLLVQIRLDRTKYAKPRSSRIRSNKWLDMPLNNSSATRHGNRRRATRDPGRMEDDRCSFHRRTVTPGDPALRMGILHRFFSRRQFRH